MPEIPSPRDHLPVEVEEPHTLRMLTWPMVKGYGLTLPYLGPVVKFEFQSMATLAFHSSLKLASNVAVSAAD